MIPDDRTSLNDHSHHPHPSHPSQPPPPSQHHTHDTFSPPATRANKIQQLRAHHQQRHRERQGQYPMDSKEEMYEKQLKQHEDVKKVWYIVFKPGTDTEGFPWSAGRQFNFMAGYDD